MKKNNNNKEKEEEEEENGDGCVPFRSASQPRVRATDHNDDKPIN